MSAEGLGTNGLVRETGKERTAVWRWQERFMHEGVAGLLRDKTRSLGRFPLPEATVARVLELIGCESPGKTIHRTAPAMAKVVWVSASSVRRICHAHGFAPHRIRRFKLSNDPDFAAKLTKRHLKRGAFRSIVE